MIVRKIVPTADNSKTLLIPGLNETYHSTHGAVQEGKHVFIEHGLAYIKNTPIIEIFEMGFGTGLNALLSLEFAVDHKLNIHYTSIEKFPLSTEIIDKLGYGRLLDPEKFEHAYTQMHTTSPSQNSIIHQRFSLEKIEGDILNIDLPPDKFDIVYYDAFGPKTQAELWEEEPLRKMYNCLKQGGILVTYCAQGQFKRNLKAVGFEVESLPGPPGKREMTRARKRQN